MILLYGLQLSSPLCEVFRVLKITLSYLEISCSLIPAFSLLTLSWHCGSKPKDDHQFSLFRTLPIVLLSFLSCSDLDIVAPFGLGSFPAHLPFFFFSCLPTLIVSFEIWMTLFSFVLSMSFLPHRPITSSFCSLERYFFLWLLPLRCSAIASYLKVLS